MRFESSSRPRLRHDDRSGQSGCEVRLSRPDVLLLQSGLLEKVSGAARCLSFDGAGGKRHAVAGGTATKLGGAITGHLGTLTPALSQREREWPTFRLPPSAFRLDVRLPDGPGDSSTGPRNVSQMRHGAGTGNDRPARDAHRVDLPDASGNCARRAGKLPDLRDGVGAENRDGGRGAESRTGRHVAAVLAKPEFERAAVFNGDVGHAARPYRWSIGSVPTALRWLQFALATPVVLLWGWPIFERGWQSIVHRSLNMFTLIAIGTGAAYGFSVIATIAPQVVSRIASQPRRTDWRVLRIGGRDHYVGAIGPGARTASARANLERHSRAVGTGPENGAAN